MSYSIGSQNVKGRAAAGERISLLGVPIDAVRLREVLQTVIGAVERRRRLTVLYVNVHCINVASGDVEYRQILQAADLVYCDGTGVRLGSWIAGKTLPARMTGADWIHDFCRVAAARRWRVFLLGGRPGVAEEAGAVLSRMYPGLVVAGTAGGYVRDESLVDRINRAQPDVLLVGMGTPTQEKWIGAHRDAMEVPVIWAVGALFDFVTGHIPRGPRWMTEHGLEWACRLVVEPRKLWRRYLVGNPVFIWRILRAYRAPSWTSSRID